jgi:hypothetical protein
MAPADTPGQRRAGYRRKPLTAAATFGYLARTIVFRMFRMMSRGGGIDVCDRYFYDNLAHYELRSPLERIYERVLRAWMPTPDLAILVGASPGTLATRRPDYSADYLATASGAFAELHQRWPELVEINTDPDTPFHDRLEAVVTDYLDTSALSPGGR